MNDQYPEIFNQYLAHTQPYQEFAHSPLAIFHIIFSGTLIAVALTRNPGNTSTHVNLLKSLAPKSLIREIAAGLAELDKKHPTVYVRPKK